MNYRSLVHQFTHDGYMKKLAGSIKLRLSNLRQKSNPNDERRWIWELIQNGKDARYSEVPFKAEIHLKGNKDTGTLEFKHNGRPFSVKNITYLVEQVSSKDQEWQDDGRPLNTGKFGSGFLTTHLLSEKVTLQTVVKAEELEYKQCSIELDRSPRDEAGIITSIQTSLSVLEKLDEIPDYDTFQPEQLNTTFRYELDPHGIQVAKTGLDDLDQALGYTLVFVPSITEVTVINKGITYRLKDELTYTDGPVTFYTIEKSHIFEEPKLIALIVAKGSQVHIALPVVKKEDTFFIAPIPSGLPRLFCDFPLIGTEDFPFPVVINSPFFDLNDPRSIVRLTDVTEPEIQENKKLLQEATQLYIQVLDYCANHGIEHLFNLAPGEMVPDKDWISTTWYQQQVADPIFDALTKATMVDTIQGKRQAIRDEKGYATALFPASSSEKTREAIFDLAVQLYPHVMPRREEIHAWHAVLWPKCLKLTIKQFSSFVAGEETIQKLQQRLGEKAQAIVWLNAYYDLLNVEGHYIKDVIANEIAILPDQNGTFKKMKDLHFGPGISNVFKDALKLLGYDIRAELRVDAIYTANKHVKDPKMSIGHSTKKPEEVYALLNRRIKEAKPDQAFTAAIQLVQIFSKDAQFPAYREKLFQAVQRIYSEQPFSKIVIPTYDPAIFDQADLVLLDNLVSGIAAAGDLKRFTTHYQFTDKEEASHWLADFVTLLLEMKQEGFLMVPEKPILPNQHGIFLVKEALSAGPGTDETLKSIAKKLGYDFRDTLIDPGLPVTFASPPITNEVVAEKIVSLAGNLMADMRNDEDTQEAFLLLFNWFSLHAAEAERLFGELYRSRHRLCSAETVVSSLETKAKVDAVLKEKGYDNLDQLLESIEHRTESSQPLTAVTQDILVSLGIRNFGEFQEALKDKNLGALFGHVSVPSTDYFIFAQALIEQSRGRIKTFLEALGYDFSSADRTAATVYSGVVKNQGEPFDIVFRPGHNGEVIFYYGAEKQTLESPTAELWVDLASGDPLQLTLGRILRINNITKVRLD